MTKIKFKQQHFLRKSDHINVFRRVHSCGISRGKEEEETEQKNEKKKQVSSRGAVIAEPNTHELNLTCSQREHQAIECVYNVSNAISAVMRHKRITKFI